MVGVWSGWEKSWSEGWYANMLCFGRKVPKGQFFFNGIEQWCDYLVHPECEC